MVHLAPGEAEGVPLRALELPDELPVAHGLDDLVEVAY